MRRRDQAIYLAHLALKLTAGAAIGGRAIVKRQARSFTDKWLP